MDTTATLLATEQIKALKARYCRGVDTKDMKLFRSVFTEDAIFDGRGSATDPITGTNAAEGMTEAALCGIEEIIGSLAPLLGHMVSVHQVCMPEIEIVSATQASAIWAMFDIVHFPAGPIAQFSGYGHYHETYERQNGDWKIKTLQITRLRLDIVSRD